MALLKLSYRIKPTLLLYHARSSSTRISIEKITDRLNVAVLTMHRTPVNSLDFSFTKELSAAITEVESDTKVDALVIKSSIPGQFSAGLDLNELYRQSPEHLKQFWKSVQDFWLQLYSSRLATVAHINGHCLAAGIIVAAACDYRLAVEGEYKLGITAAKVGLVAPSWVMEMIAQIIGRRRVEFDIPTGTVYSPEEALEIGLIDALCTVQSGDEVCLEVVRRCLSVSQLSRVTMKSQMREKFICEFKRRQSDDLSNFVEFVSQDVVQQSVGEYFNKMKKVRV